MTEMLLNQRDTDVPHFERVKTGDEAASNNYMIGLVFKILNDAPEAEDVVQEGFHHIRKEAAFACRNAGSAVKTPTQQVRRASFQEF